MSPLLFALVDANMRATVDDLANLERWMADVGSDDSSRNEQREHVVDATLDVGWWRSLWGVL